MNELEHQVGSAFPLKNWVNTRTLVAVSGGPDSVALLRAMVAIGKRSDQWQAAYLSVAHVKHGTRGSESDRDAQFVVNFADELGLESHQMNVKPTPETSASEESLREFRYGQLIDMAHERGARYIVTGHNRDDQIETILFRIFRGTGISGLAGIPQQRLAGESVTIVRPLLEVGREMIESYLTDIGQTYRSDSSNADSKYTRNFLRNELIPELKQRFGVSVSDSICRLGTQAQELDLFLLTQSRQLNEAILERTENRLAVDCGKIQRFEPLIVRRWLTQIWTEQTWPRQAMTYQWWQTIADSLQSEASDAKTVLNLPCSIRFEKTGLVAVFSDLRQSKN